LKLPLALAVFITILLQKCRFVIWNLDIQITFKHILFVSQRHVKFCFDHVVYLNLLSWVTSNSMLRVAKAPSQFCLLTDLKLLIRKHSGFLLSLSSLTRINITLTINSQWFSTSSQRCFLIMLQTFSRNLEVLSNPRQPLTGTI